MSDQWRLLADVGGTNIRFGLVRDGRSGHTSEVERIQSWPCDTFDDFDAALSAYRATLDADVRFSSVAIAAAGPSAPGEIRLTNRDWAISVSGIERTIGYAVPTRLLNDLEAVANALPFLPESRPAVNDLVDDAVEWWDSVRPPGLPAGRRLAVNVGTGFGSAAIIKTSDRWVCCPAESGHIHLGPADDRERALFTRLGLSSATVEDILSGDGVRRLWQTFHSGGTPSNVLTSPQAIEPFDFAANDPATNDSRHVFGAVLGRVMANLVLASTAWDGVYLCGSVALAWSQHADRAAFRRSFSGTSKMHERLAETPIGLIHHPFPAFVGLANLHIGG